MSGTDESSAAGATSRSCYGGAKRGSELAVGIIMPRPPLWRVALRFLGRGLLSDFHYAVWERWENAVDDVHWHA